MTISTTANPALPAHPDWATTDPELLAGFEHFANIDVPASTSLPLRLRQLASLAALIACQAREEFVTLLESAIGADISPVDAKELTYQAVPYVGMAKAAPFIDAVNSVLVAHDIALPLAPQATTTPASRHALGLAAQKQIVGSDAVDKMYATAPVDQAHIQKFLSANCFGDNYTRGGLDLATRELMTFVFIAAHGGCDPQVKGHVTGNINVGNGRAMLIDVLTQLLPLIGYPRTLNALRAINDAAPL